jgi:hypothetical protein
LGGYLFTHFLSLYLDSRATPGISASNVIKYRHKVEVQKGGLTHALCLEVETQYISLERGIKWKYYKLQRENLE